MVFVINRRGDLTLEAARHVAWHGESVEIGDRTAAAMVATRKRFMDILDNDSDVTIHGVTTGYGQPAKRKPEAGFPQLLPRLRGTVCCRSGSSD